MELIAVDHRSAQDVKDVIENTARWNNIHILSLNQSWIMTPLTVFISPNHSSLLKQS